MHVMYACKLHVFMCILFSVLWSIFYQHYIRTLLSYRTVFGQLLFLFLINYLGAAMARTLFAVL